MPRHRLLPLAAVAVTLFFWASAFVAIRHLGPDVSPGALNAKWHYNWDNNQNSARNWEYVPIKQQPHWPGLGGVGDYQTQQVNHVLGFNEPTNGVRDPVDYIEALAPKVFVPNHHDFVSEYGSGRNFEGAVRRELAGREVATPELRWLYDPADYGADEMAEDARRLLDHLDIATADVVGYSMGARLAALLAIRRGDRVRRAVLAGLAANMIHGLGGAETIARGFEAEDPGTITDPAARAFRSESTVVNARPTAASAVTRFQIPDAVPSFFKEIFGIVGVCALCPDATTNLTLGKWFGALLTDTPHTVEVDTLPGGAVHVRNPARGLWDDDPGQRWRVVEANLTGSPYCVDTGFSATDLYIAVLSRCPIDLIKQSVALDARTTTPEETRP